MSIGLLGLYALAKRSQTKRREEAQTQEKLDAEKFDVFGRIGGKGAIVKQSDNMEGFVPLYARFGNGQVISVPKEATASTPLQDLYSVNVPGSENFSQSELRTKPEYLQIFAAEGASPDQINDKMAALHFVAQRNPTTNQFNLNEGFSFKPSDNSAAGKDYAIAGEVPGYTYKNLFFADKDYPKALAEFEKNKKTGDTEPIYRVIRQQRMSVEGNRYFDFTDMTDVSDTFAAALSVEKDGIKHKVDGKDKFWISSASTAAERTQDFREWIASKVANQYDFEAGMDAGTLAKIHSRMYNYILAERSPRASGTGVVIPDPTVLSRVVPAMYPSEFAVPGFEKKFMQKVKGIPHDRLVNAAKDLNSSPQGNASWVQKIEGNEGISAVIKTTLDPVPQHIPAYQKLLSWSANQNENNSDPVLIAKARVGNILNLARNPADPTGSLIAGQNQYELTRLSKLIDSPSIGIAPDYLSNAAYYYDPAVYNFVPIDRELEAVADAIQNVPYDNNVAYNRKLSMVAMWAPNLSVDEDPNNSLSVSQIYRSQKFKDDRFKGKAFQDMQDREGAVSRSSLEAARLIRQSQSLLFIVGDNGQINMTPFGQQVASGFVSLRGFYVNAKAALNLAAENMGFAKDSPVIAGVSSMMDTASEVMSAIEEKDPDAGNKAVAQFGSYRSAAKLTGAELQEAAARKGQTVDEFVRKENDARQQNLKSIRDLTTRMASAEGLVANTAKRAYLNYIIAYSVAAALQGGTGGRTISDQDVQNVLNAIQPGRFSEASQEYAVLNALHDDLMYRAQKGAALSSSRPQTVYNAMILADLEARAGFDINNEIQNRIDFQTGADQPGQKPESKTKGMAVGEIMIPSEMTDRFLSLVNKDMRMDKETSSLNFKSMQDFLNDNTISAARKQKLAERFMKRQQ